MWAHESHSQQQNLKYTYFYVDLVGFVCKISLDIDLDSSISLKM